MYGTRRSIVQGESSDRAGARYGALRDTGEGVFGIGADLGGTKVSAVVISPDGNVVKSDYRVHDGTGVHALASLTGLIEELAAQAPGQIAVGVAAAGLIDRVSGELVHSALLDIHAAPLGPTLAAKVGVDVLIENDANAALIGIHADTTPRETAVLFALGTGVGGALYIAGNLVEGSFGFAAELGHVPVERQGLHPCPCGSSGCLELFASGTAVAARAYEAGLPGEGGSRPRAEDVVRAARAADSRALEILRSAGDAIGTVLAGLIPAVDPAVAYISGGFGHAAAAFLVPAIEQRVAAQLPFSQSRPAPRVLTDPIGPLAAAIGAARLAQRRASNSTHVVVPPTQPTP